MKNQKGGSLGALLPHLAGSKVQLVISSLVKVLLERES